MTIDQNALRVAHNVAVHDRIARRYDKLHGEIFNDIEQARLHDALARARAAVRTGAEPVQALDFGCGSGNLSRHLLDLGVNVTAADVSQGFLQLVRSRHPTERLTTLHMPEGSLGAVPDSSFDLIATYSVLHHIPDYLAAIVELARLCKPGGVIMLDHEPTPTYWDGDPLHRTFQREALRFDWRKYLVPSNYVHRFRRLFNPRHTNEGDIHVWPDDHVEWPRIAALLSEKGFEVVADEDYLLNRALYQPEVYARYRNRCTDTKMMMFRKCAE